MRTSLAQQARERAGLTLQQVADRLGYHVRTIRDAELRTPSEHLATKLARLYGCPIDFFTPQGSGLKGSAWGSGAGRRAHSPVESAGDRRAVRGEVA